MKKYILWPGISVLLTIMLAACGNGEDVLPFMSMIFEEEESASRDSFDAEGSQSAYDLLGRPLPTDTPVEESGGEKQGEQAMETSPQPEENIVSITISAAGDCSLGNHQDQEYAYSFRQAYDQIEDEGFFSPMCRIISAMTT